MTVADQDELHKFAHTADQWWDPEGEYAPLYRIQPVRLDYIRAQVDVTNKRVLELIRSRFRAGMVRAVAISLILYGLGSAVIKWNWIQPPEMGVFHPFWIGSLAGGLVFGIGMLLAGGCASSTLWRAAEGHMKLMVALVCFAVTNPAVHAAIEITGVKNALGSGVFMPELLSWQVALPVFAAVMLLWVLLGAWNEKTEKLVIF